MPRDGHAGPGRELGQSRHLRGHRDPDRVPEAHLVGAQIEEAQGDLDRALGRDRADVGAAEGGRHVRAAPPAELGRAVHDRIERGQRLGDGHADVVRGERVGRGREHGQRIGAGRLGPLEPARVRNEDGVTDVPDRGRDLSSSSASASWGTARGATKLVGLDLTQAGRDQQLDEAPLVGRRDGTGLVLEPVTRSDLVDPDVLGHRLLDERWLHRPLDPGDLDLDPSDLRDGVLVRLAAERGRVAPRPRGPMQGQQLLAGRGQGRGRCPTLRRRGGAAIRPASGLGARRVNSMVDGRRGIPGRVAHARLAGGAGPHGLAVRLVLCHGPPGRQG